MEVIILQAFASLMLVAGAVVLFVHSWRQRDFDHADRLALLPVDDEPPANATDARSARADEPTRTERS